MDSDGISQIPAISGLILLMYEAVRSKVLTPSVPVPNDPLKLNTRSDEPDEGGGGGVGAGVGVGVGVGAGVPPEPPHGSEPPENIQPLLHRHQFESLPNTYTVRLQ